MRVTKKIIRSEEYAFELLTVPRQAEFVGLGRVWIGKTLVRSGRLPLRPYTQTFGGLELAGLKLLSADPSRIRLEAQFRKLPIKQMRDHSFDPIHELGDWDGDGDAGTARLELRLQPATDSFNGVDFAGFSYHWEYRSQEVPIFWLLDRASWELDGEITGATAISQSSCSAPVATFDETNGWSTEGILPFLLERQGENPVMTHNLPRWASHGSFDFQHKNDRTLIGVFEQVALIRSVICRDAGSRELKHFDKHIFDQALKVKTVPKKILLHRGAKTATARHNLWTWIHDEVDTRARAEFGLRQEPPIPRISMNYWRNFTIDTYYKDLLPAAIGIGAKQLFVDNLNRSDLTDGGVSKNMCNGHEYEIAPALGGPDKLKALVAEAQAHGIQIMSWTNNDQSYGSPLNFQDAAPKYKDWWVRMEDARLAYGGAYTNTFTIWDFNCDEARNYWLNSLKQTRATTGLNGYLFDSFYNLGFMPVSYRNCQPRTMWRKLLEAFKELQDADIHFLIESFGPFGCPQHGHPASYHAGNIFVCYYVGLGNGSVTVPVPGMGDPRNDRHDAAFVFYQLAHKVPCHLPLFIDGKRIDQVYGPEHRRILRDYHEQLAFMHRRYLQEDGLGVLWHDADQRRATLWNFVDRQVSLPGEVADLTTGQTLAPGAVYRLEPCHVYAVKASVLPTVVGDDPNWQKG